MPREPSAPAIHVEVERLRGTLSQLLLFARGNEHVQRLIHDTLDAR